MAGSEQQQPAEKKKDEVPLEIADPIFQGTGLDICGVDKTMDPFQDHLRHRRAVRRSAARGSCECVGEARPSKAACEEL